MSIADIYRIIALFFPFIIIVAIIAYFITRPLSKARGINANKRIATNDVGQKYTRNTFINQSELHFLGILKDLEPQGFNVAPQIHLPSVIRGGTHQHDLDRTISFGVFDKDYKLLLLVDIDQTPYRDSDTQQQNERLGAICDQVGIKLLVFRPDKPHTKDYILQQVLDAIKPVTKKV